MPFLPPVPSSHFTCLIGIRVKARSGETGEIKGVTYSGITLKSISKYVSLSLAIAP